MNIIVFFSIFIIFLSLFFYLYLIKEKKLQRLNWELESFKSLSQDAQNELLKAKQLLEVREKESRELHQENAVLTVKLEEEKKKREELLRVEEVMKTTFKAVSSDALRLTQTSFFELAKETFDKYQTGMKQELTQKELAIDTLLKPLKESLEKVDVKIQELEKSRVGAYSGVTEQLKTMHVTQMQLEIQTATLVKALRTPNVRGKWGELQLRRVVEMAGMVEHCDFETQETFDTADGKIRPDLIVKLPNSRTIIVDAKAPLQAYLEAIEAQDDNERALKFKEHAKQLRKHLMQLGEKAYWEEFSRAPEFVVLFLPGESFFAVALDHDPSLIEFGVDKKVLIATPTTLIALLRAVAYGFREAVVAEHAERISELGKSLYDRLLTMVEHFQKLKRALDTSTEAYNKVVGCFEGRVLVAARRFQDMGVSQEKPELEELELQEKITRSIESIITKEDVVTT
jgi:DNA recombination protein RmuC